MWMSFCEKKAEEDAVFETRQKSRGRGRDIASLPNPLPLWNEMQFKGRMATVKPAYYPASVWTEVF